MLRMTLASFPNKINNLNRRIFLFFWTKKAFFFRTKNQFSGLFRKKIVLILEKKYCRTANLCKVQHV